MTGHQRFPKFSMGSIEEFRTLKAQMPRPALQTLSETNGICFWAPSTPAVISGDLSSHNSYLVLSVVSFALEMVEHEISVEDWPSQNHLLPR